VLVKGRRGKGGATKEEGKNHEPYKRGQKRRCGGGGGPCKFS